MFRFNHHRQGAHYLSLLKLQLLKYSVKIHRCGWFGGVAAYFIMSGLVCVWCTVWNESHYYYFIMITLITITLASSNNTLPDDGD